MRAPEPKPKKRKAQPMTPAQVEKRRNYYGPNPGYSDSWEFNMRDRIAARDAARLTGQASVYKRKGTR